MEEKKGNNKVYPWGNERRFNSYSGHFMKFYGSRVQKVSIDAGFTCPNRDGSKGTGGCSYCDNRAFNPSYCNPSKSISLQIREGIKFHRKRYRRSDSYIAYFQAFSNTYAPVGMLERMYNEAMTCDGIMGLIIGTRPDCVDSKVLDLLAELSKKHYVAIEYGIESCFNKTLRRINRGHSFEESVEALNDASARGLKTGAHFIFGLPGETREQMLDEADIISELPLNTVKFHQLQIIKSTAIEVEFRKNPGEFKMFSLDEYIDFITEFLEKLNPSLVVERFTGEVPPRYLSIEPWSGKRNDQIMNLIVNKLEELDTWQGKCFRLSENKTKQNNLHAIFP